MNKIFAVARWEYVEKIRTKAFLISLIITPVIIIGFTLGGTLLSGQSSQSTKVIGFVDKSGIYFNPVKNKIEELKSEDGQPAYILINFNDRDKSLNKLKSNVDSLVINRKIEGCILIANGGTDSIIIEYRSLNSVNYSDTRKFENAFNEVKTEIILRKNGIGKEVIDEVSREIDITSIMLNEKGEASKSDFLATFFTSIIFIMMLMTMVLASGGMLVRSLVEEKSNRLIDIIVSSCTSDELLAGKILGLSSLGLTQLLLWSIIGFILSGFSVIPPNSLQNIFPILIYFLLGYIFYTAIFVGVGSIVTTEQEAQQINGYLSILLVFPVILAFPAIENPETGLIKIFSYIPLTLPAIMMLRLNLAPVPMADIIITISIMAVSIYLTVRASAKIFRIGILSYGKMPTLKELIRWLRE